MVTQSTLYVIGKSISIWRIFPDNAKGDEGEKNISKSGEGEVGEDNMDNCNTRNDDEGENDV